MKRVEIDGVEYFQWEEGDETRRRRFEEAIGATECLNAIFDAIMKSWGKTRADHAEAWGTIREMIQELGGTSVDSQNMSYDWFRRRFRLIATDKPRNSWPGESIAPEKS